MNRSRNGLVFGVVAACVCVRGERLHGQSERIDDEKAIKVKAAYLFNFTKFVTWPAIAFEHEASPIVIGVVGTDPFGDVLDQTLRDKTVSGRKLEARRFSWRSGDDVSSAKKCHLLYFSPSLGDHAQALIRGLAKSHVLLVGEGEGFCKVGGMIGFVIDNARVVFWANQTEAAAAGLELSAQLLKLAQLVETVVQNADPHAGTKTKGE